SPDPVDSHVAVGPLLQLFLRQGILVGCPDQKGTKVTGIVGVGKRTGGCCPQLAQKRPNSGDGSDDIVRGEGDNGILNGIFRNGHVFPPVPEIGRASCRERDRHFVLYMLYEKYEY